MKVLLVSDQGQLLASMENLERYDTAKPGDLFALLDFMERLIATAKGSERWLSSVARPMTGSTGFGGSGHWQEGAMTGMKKLGQRQAMAQPAKVSRRQSRGEPSAIRAQRF